MFENKTIEKILFQNIIKFYVKRNKKFNFEDLKEYMDEIKMIQNENLEEGKIFLTKNLELIKIASIAISKVLFIFDKEKNILNQSWIKINISGALLTFQGLLTQIVNG